MSMGGWNRWRGGGVASVLLGALLLAWLLASGGRQPPVAAEEAKADALPADLAKVPTDSMMVVSGDFAGLWNSELLKTVREKYKTELDAGSKGFTKQFGLRLEQVQRTTMILLDPPPSAEEPLLFLRTVETYDLAKVLAAGKNVKAKKYKDETLYVGDEAWAVYPLDKQSLVYGKADALRALIDHPQPKKEGNLAGAVRLAAGKHTTVYAVNVQKFNDGLGDKLGEEVAPFRPLLQALSVTFLVDLGKEAHLSATVKFANEKEAKAAVKPAEKGLVLLRAGLDRVFKEVGDDKETAATLKLLKQLQEPVKAMRIEQKGELLSASMRLRIDPATAGLALMEAVQKVRQGAARQQSVNNLKQIALAMYNYASTFNDRLPPQATFDKNGKPLLSWRVTILPFIEQQELYKQFHLDEPWDSEHNKKLLAKMPKIYASTQDEKTVKEHKTYYQGFYGKGAFFEGKKGLRMPQDFLDGTSNTFMIVEASKAVPWTKPEDIVYDPGKPLPKLGLPGAAFFLASLCDGSVRTCSHKIAEKTLRLVIERDDGMPIPADF